MSREEWRNKIARATDDGVMLRSRAEAAADAVLALLEAEGRVLWWCPIIHQALEESDCRNGAKHRRGVFIELDKP